jgi:ribosomal-protein-alanine N-acetyltransferase
MLMRLRSEAPCEYLDWDSRHFGLRIGRVQPSALRPDGAQLIEDWRRRESVDCLYLLAPLEQSDAFRLAEDLGFRFVDIRITLERVTAGGVAASSETRGFHESDLPRLIQLARTLHEDSRFFVDHRFPEAASRALFEAWMIRACSDPSYDTLVAGAEGSPVGYVACQRLADGCGQIQLIGVDEPARRRGLGAALVDAALVNLARQDATRVRVVTQGRNLAALRLYESCGFRTVSQAAWYHWWSDAPLAAERHS